MKNIVIVESPAKAKTISKYLGDDYEVVSCKGHIRDLATSGKDGFGVDVDNDFLAKYIINKDKKTLVKDLKKQVKGFDKVFLASDPDREGEAIAWSLAEELDLDLKDENRIVFNEVTKMAVSKSLSMPRTIDMDLVHSQETRRIIDRIIGFKLSKLLQRKIKSRSAGRVQSVALQLIVDREKEIEKFIPVEYWTIEANFENEPNFTANLTKIDGKKAEINNQTEADLILSKIDKFTVSDIKKTIKKRNPKLPFITSTLQQEASTKLGFSAKKTMSVAQKLYEGIKLKDGLVGLITYMRSDSYRLSDGFLMAAKQQILDVYGEKYVGFYSSKANKNAQDAHEAIRPTYPEYTPDSIQDNLTNDEFKLYSLIYARAMATVMKAAEFESNSIILNTDIYQFNANGSIMLFDGYLKIYGKYETNKNEMLPVLTANQVLEAKEVIPTQHFTEPPLRYSEARLIKELEEKGIGRPSTYASIIDKIVERLYVELKKASEGSKTKVFFPTDQGKLTDSKLSEYFSSIINVKYTSNMETQLDEIAEGNLEYLKVLREFYDKLIPLVDSAYEGMEKIEDEKTGEQCPECGKDLVYRQGKYGKFIACSGYPECKYIVSLKKKVEPIFVGRDCPECSSPLVERVSRYKTKFVGCSNYPKCRYIESNKEEKK